MGLRQRSGTDRTPGAGRGRQGLALAGFAAAVFVVAAIGGLGVRGTGDEYQSLRQPSWAPPAELFGPVWTILYAMIALAGWLVWRRAGFGPALGVYAAQLVLNAIWTPLFFGAGRDAGVRPADLVGAIANEAGVPARTLGAIEIADTSPSENILLIHEALTKLEQDDPE